MASLDLKELESELSRTKKKVLDWARNRQTVAADRRDLHAWKTQDQTGKLCQLQAQQAQLMASVNDVRQRVESEQLEAQRLQEACTSLSAEQATAQRKLSSAQSSLATQQEGYRRQLAALSYEERAKTKKVDSLRKAVDLFSNQLGLRFKKGTDELHLVFTHIDTRDANREFTFAVRILGDNTYTVTKCEPHIAGLTELEAQLNQNLDFAGFVKEVRRRFVRLTA